MDMHRNRNNSFVGLSPLVLFLSSYIPLFGLIALRQFYNNLIYLNWSGFNKPAIICFLSKFGISVLCLIIIVFGLIGTYFFTLDLLKKTQVMVQQLKLKTFLV